MYPSVTRVLGPYIDWSHVPPDRLRSAGERGTRVHNACEAIAQDVWPVYQDDIKGYVKSFESWYKMMGPTVILVEPELVSEIYGFMGHPDLVLGIGHGTWLIDIKTPVTISKTWGPQLGAYDHLVSKSGITCNRVGFLQLHPKGGKAKYTDIKPVENFAWFLNALAAHNYFAEEGKVDDTDDRF